MIAPEQRRPARVCPVYSDLTDVLVPERLNTANTGLLYDRYADIWSGTSGGWKPQAGDRGPSVPYSFLSDVRNGLAARVSAVQPLLDGLHRRRDVLWQQLAARPVEVVAAGPLVSGLGMTHALGVGFVWDRNLGIPYLPASGLKGAARAWAEQWGGMSAGDALRIFGDLEREGVGSVVFHSLYPTRVPALRVDVLNPHFGEYYRDNERAPGDWLSPVPVFFLTVAPGSSFRTALHARLIAEQDDLAGATRCLREAMANLGLGGKTALGYGLFTEPGPTAPDAQRKQAAPIGNQAGTATAMQGVRIPPPVQPGRPPQQREQPATLEELVQRQNAQRQQRRERQAPTRESQRARDEQRRIMEQLRRGQPPKEPPRR